MQKNNQNGFSLIELLLVVVIIGIIASIAVPSLAKAKEAAERGSTYSTMRVLSTLQVKFHAQNSRFGLLSELNNGLDINLGTNIENSFSRSRFNYTMIVNSSTDETLKSEYNITATRPGTGTQPPTLITVSQSGQIVGIID